MAEGGWDGNERFANLLQETVCSILLTTRG